MINITLWDIAAFAAAEALIYAGPVLLVVTLLLLGVPALRRRTGLRRTGYGMLAVLVLLVVVSMPFLSWTLDDWRRRRAFQADTHHLAAPQDYGGITFPAGSTVHVTRDGIPEFGSVPVPTTIQGLPLVGDFVLDVEFDAERGSHLGGTTSGTLASPIDIHGIPCGPGPVVSKEETTRCTLARDHLVLGHLLAAGQPLEIYRSPLHDLLLLRFGSLARPELLYDVRWPAGTVLIQVHERPERMAHGPGPDSWLIDFCLPSGATADIGGGVVLHGFLRYGVQQGRRLVSPVCGMLPEGRVGTDGYAQVGPDRFTWGERPDAASPWTWTTPFEPSD